MYHVAKVLKVISTNRDVISADNYTQAMLEMWDENVITVLVHPMLAKEIKENDIVLVDYRPKKGSPAPNMVVCKIKR